MSWISDLFGGGTRTVQSSTSSPPPAWIQEEGEGVFRTAKDLATRPYEPSPVGRVAGISPEREQSFDLIRKGIGSWGPDMGAARGYASSAGMSTPDAMRAGGYMNPYTEDVINPTIDDIMKASGIERSRIATMAGMSGAEFAWRLRRNPPSAASCAARRAHCRKASSRSACGST